MIACNKHLVLIWQFYQPVKEIEHLLLCPHIGKVATMDKNIGSWQVSQLPMTVVRVRNLNNSHTIQFYLVGISCSAFSIKWLATTSSAIALIVRNSWLAFNFLISFRASASFQCLKSPSKKLAPKG